MTPIRLTTDQRFELDLAVATQCVDGLDADTAAYLSYLVYKGEIPEDKLVARTCEQDLCMNPDHLILVGNNP